MFVQTAEDLGRLIREARLRRGLSQAALAARFGTTQSWVSEVENGKDTAELGMILKALAQLGLALDVMDRTAQTPGQPDDSLFDYPDLDDIVARRDA